MQLPLELRIAWRYLFSKKRHAAVNLISSISVAGVAIASATVVIALSVFNGFIQLAESRFSRLSAPVEIESEEANYFDATPLMDILCNIGEAGTALPILRSKAYVDAPDGQMAVKVTGADQRWMDTSGASSTVIDGMPIVADTLGSTLGVISVGTAMQTGIRPGDRMRLVVPRNRERLNPGNITGNFRSDTIVVSGVTRTGEDKLDAALVIVPLPQLRQLLSADSGSVSHIDVYPADGTDTESLVKAVRLNLPPGFKAMTIAEQNADSFKMIEIEKWVTFVLLAFILIVASFNILSTLVMLMIEKRNNMRLLRSMGMADRRIKKIFIWEGVLVSGAGCLAGAIAGMILVGCQMQWGWVKLSAAGIDPSLLSIPTYPVALSAEDLLAVLALAAITSFLASFVAVVVGRKNI
ncbi:MAG: FtsX-like permease family protein [Muribaculaceae bacterium]|nr:FtsX-like permease family protein [Muribaculaceae bacterium]